MPAPMVPQIDYIEKLMPVLGFNEPLAARTRRRMT